MKSWEEGDRVVRILLVYIGWWDVYIHIWVAALSSRIWYAAFGRIQKNKFVDE